MALTIEDGSIVANANSYVSVSDARSYVEARGGSFPVENIEGEHLVLQAMDFFESHSDRFKGERTSKSQDLCWPRNGAIIEGWEWGSNEVPRQVITTVLALAFEINQGADPYNPEVIEAPITKKKVGPIETTYATTGRVSKVIKSSKSSTLLNLLLKSSGLSLVRA